MRTPRPLMTAPSIDVLAARRRFERAASTYGEVAVLAREVERRMAERLDYMRHDPQWVLDAGCGPGEGLGLLRKRYPKARLIGLDIARAMTHSARQARTILGWARDLFSGAACHHVCADLARLPLAPASVAMVWSNLALAWAADPPAALSELARVLEPRGLLMFSTYGPDTLKELRGAFAGVDGYAHVHRFIDMHDLGDMLVAAGFADPVMDMEMVTFVLPRRRGARAGPAALGAIECGDRSPAGADGAGCLDKAGHRIRSLAPGRTPACDVRDRLRPCVEGITAHSGAGADRRRAGGENGFSPEKSKMNRALGIEIP